MAIDSTAGGYWRQEDGTFIKIAEMETSEIVNLMQMLENRAKAREYCRCWSATWRRRSKVETMSSSSAA